MSTAGKVLVIDDDASLRRVIEFTLQQPGYEVTAVEDGAAGMASFANEHQPVVITDVQMPGLSGYEVLKQLRAEEPQVQVIIVTAFGTVEQAVAAMKEGAFDYITKPFSRDELLLVVRRAFEMLDLRSENARLRQQLSGRVDLSQLVGTSEAMQRVCERVRKVASSDAPVLLQGESGTGKELVARAIHFGGERRDQPFVPVNCAAIPADLLESELFGHVKGAFTGALRDRPGKFQQADRGTLFLDEIGEMPLGLQPKLLRVLQEMEVEPVGSGKTQRVDVRIVAASNRDLEQEVAAGRFREDLFYRLAVIPLPLPALRERRDDIPLLVRHFLARHEQGGRISVAAAALDLLRAYDWPGNVRELQNVLEQTVLLRAGDGIEADDLPSRLRSESRAVAGTDTAVVRLPQQGYSLAEIEREAVVQALELCHWNQTRAAKLLQIPRHTLVYRMEKYALHKP